MQNKYRNWSLAKDGIGPFFIIFLLLLNGCALLPKAIEETEALPEIMTITVEPIAVAPLREVRAVWMSRFDYSESAKSKTPDSIRMYIESSFQKFKAANINTIIFQVRGNGDAFYQSAYEPWSHMLSDSLGKDPGWDPLAFAVESAHKRGLELHAWINTFPAWRGLEDPIPTTPLQPYLAHPEWIVCDSSGTPMPKSDHYISFSPGIPAARRHIVNVVLDIINKYDVDGIHFDYIRYPENSPNMGYSHDSISVARFNSPESNPLQLDWADWQREQVTAFISEAYNGIVAIKPWIKVSTAVIGSYNLPGWNGYHITYQDGRRWAELGKVDFLTPMSYYGRHQEGHEFPRMIRYWADLPNMEGRPILPGLGAYRLPFDEILEEIEDVREAGFPGHVLFAASSLNDENLQKIKAQKFPYPALLPVLAWKDQIAPLAPADLLAEIRDNQVQLSWTASPAPADGDIVREYVIYHVSELPIDPQNPQNILAIIPGGCYQYTVSGLDTALPHYFSVTAIDDAENQSQLSPVASVLESQPPTSESH